MNRKELALELARGTELVVAFASGRLDVREFVERYDNFYHRNALDGHEADGDVRLLLEGFVDACRLHEAVQSEFVDQLYLGRNNVEQYAAAGRVLPDAARARITEIAQKRNADALLRRLRTAAG